MYSEENKTWFENVSDVGRWKNFTDDDLNFTSLTDNLGKSRLGRREYDDIIQVKFVRYTFALLHLSMIVLAIIANFAIIVYILLNMHRRIKTPSRRVVQYDVTAPSPKMKDSRTNITTYLILNLAACDLVSASTHHPLLLLDMLMSIKRANRTDETIQTFCLVAGFFGCFLSGVAYHTVVAITQASKYKHKYYVQGTRLNWLSPFTCVLCARLINLYLSICVSITRDINDLMTNQTDVFCTKKLELK